MKYVCYALGYLRARLSTLCAKASKGGKGGYAFSIVENGGYKTDGYLIEGAEPLWNKFSNESPGEWVKPTTATGSLTMLVFRLKRYGGGNEYCFNLAHFCGYDPEASGPVLPDVEIIRLQGQTYDKLIYAGTGSYDWSKVSKEYTHARLVMTNEKGTPTPISEPMELGSTMKLQIKGTMYGSSEHDLYMALCNSIGDIGYYLPVKAHLSLIMGEPLKVRVGVYINGGSGAIIRAQGEFYEVAGGADEWTGRIRITEELRNAPNIILSGVSYSASTGEGESKSWTKEGREWGVPTSTFEFKELNVGSMLTVRVKALQEALEFATGYGAKITATLNYIK